MATTHHLRDSGIQGRSLDDFREEDLKLHVASNVPVILCGVKGDSDIKFSKVDFEKPLVRQNLKESGRHGEKVFEPKGDTGCFNNCTANAQWVQVCRKDDGTVIGYSLMSPLSPTTLPVPARRALGFPENAHEYAFLYRCEPEHCKLDAVKPGSREQLLLSNGGYVYFAPDGHVLLINAIRGDNDEGWSIDFHPGQPLKSKAVVRILHEQGRLHEARSSAHACPLRTSSSSPHLSARDSSAHAPPLSAHAPPRAPPLHLHAPQVRLEKLQKYKPAGGNLFFAWIHAREFDKENKEDPMWIVRPDEQDVLEGYIGGTGGGRVLNGAFLYALDTTGDLDAIYFPLAASPLRAEERMATSLGEMSPGRQVSHGSRQQVIKRWGESLLQAVLEGNEEAVENAFTAFADKVAEGSFEFRTEHWPKDPSFGETLLHKAARLGHVKLVSVLLDQAGEWQVTERPPPERPAYTPVATPPLQAQESARGGGLEFHKWLVQMQTSEGRTPMELAIEAKQWGTATALLHAQFASGCGRTLLHAVEIFDKASARRAPPTPTLSSPHSLLPCSMRRPSFVRRAGQLLGG